MHAGIIDAHPDCKIKFIYDINKDFVNELSSKYAATVAASSDEALTSNDS